MVRDVQALIETESKVMEVTIQSAPHDREQESVELRGIAEDSVVVKRLRRMNWSVAYKYFRETRIHQLIFSSKYEQMEQEMKEMKAQMNEYTRALDARDLTISQLNQRISEQERENEMLKEVLRQNG